MKDSDCPDILAREAEIVIAATAAAINISSNRRSLAKGVPPDQMRIGCTNAIALKGCMTGTFLMHDRKWKSMSRPFRKLDGNKPPVGPDHFAIALCTAVLEPTKSKLTRQLRHGMRNGKARSIFGNIQNPAIHERLFPSETHRCGASGRSTNGLPLFLTLVKHLLPHDAIGDNC
jgi:hypothetical protein